MIDVDAAITAELEQLVPVTAEPDWEAVAAAAGLRRSQRRLPLLSAALLLAVLTVALATPLGSAIARTLGGFSTWITGEPGAPASQAQQQRFATANAHSWNGFPTGTKLRFLTSTHAGGATVDLYGFRSGSSAFCLRLSVTGKSHWSTLSCAPLADLRRRDAPVRVVFSDQPVGAGKKTAWYGVDRLHSANLQITAGIVDDTVKAVELHDNQGRHTVPAKANAFLYVAASPEINQRVTKLWARTDSGLVAIPYVSAPSALAGPIGSHQQAPTVAVQAAAKNGRIGWLDRREQRGQPLSVLPARTRAGLLGFRGGGAHSRIVFARVITPNRDQPDRIVLTLNAHHHGGPAAGLCLETVTGNGSGGGCAVYPQTFATTPINFGSSGSGSDTFITVTGVVADSVARLRALLANHQWVTVPVTDNVFDVQLPNARLPARLVAYNKHGQTIGVSDPITNFASGGYSPTKGKAKQLLAVQGPNGAHAELLVGAATDGGQCTYVKTYIAKNANGVATSCHTKTLQGAAIQLETSSNPPLFVSGRVAANVASVRLVFSDGSTQTIRPTDHYILALVNATDRQTGISLTRIVGLNATGHTVGTERLPPPPRH